ncbi:hypothetical protein D3C81_2128250 [compost metagenome]
MRPPWLSNTWPVTWRDCSLPSQTTSGATFSAAHRSKLPSSGFFTTSAMALSVIEVRAAGARALAVMP